jgi:hypothetical protein
MNVISKSIETRNLSQSTKNPKQEKLMKKPSMNLISNRVVWGTFATMCLTAQLGANVLYYDGFDGVGANGSLIGTSGGFGWHPFNNWNYVRNQAGGTAQVLAGGGNSGFNSGNFAQITPTSGTTNVFRDFTDIIDSGTVYISAYVKNVNLGTRFVGIGLRNSSGVEVLTLGQRSGGGFWGFYSAPLAYTNRTNEADTGDSAALLILRIDFDYAPGEQRVRLYINPDLGAGEPEVADRSDIVTFIDNIASVSMGAGFAVGAQTTTIAAFDELYVTDSWNSIGMVPQVSETAVSDFTAPALRTGIGPIIAVRSEGAVDTFRRGAVLFTDRSYTVAECPPELEGLKFLRGSIDENDFEVHSDGELIILTPHSDEMRSSRANQLEQQGFERLDTKLFQLFGQSDFDRVLSYGKRVKAGENYRFGKWVVVLGIDSVERWVSQPWSENTGELLYNGIRLPRQWPPNDIDVMDHSPMRVPYLDHPPAVIPIDIGRQLFVDDFLIESTSLTRSFHAPVKYDGNPVLRPETPVELGHIEPWGREQYDMEVYHARAPAPVETQSAGHAKPYGHGNASAAPKSGGCWWDPEEQIYKMWYETSWFGPMAMATSKDGIHWDRPQFDILPGTNIVSPLGVTPDSWTVVRNWNATVPDEKWTLFLQPPGVPQPGLRMTSPDGIHWSRREPSGFAGDRSTHHFNPFRNKWIFSLRTGFHGAGDRERGRGRLYHETTDFLEPAWQRGDPVTWLMTDEQDSPDYLIMHDPQLYNFDAVAYESIMLGFFQLHLGPENRRGVKFGYPKMTELMYAFSRDGFHYDRPDRRAHIPASRGDFWDRGYVQSLGNICVIHGDHLYFYYAGFAGNAEKAGTANGLYDQGATGLAILRRDGFASMNADVEPGVLTTRPVTFSGRRLFVNAEVPSGTLRVEVRDEQGNPIKPFTLANSVPFKGDKTLVALEWKDGADLSSLAGQSVRFHFELTNGSLYAFWVSRDESGRSDGYVAGGGPGYTGPTDTVGRAALNN